MFLKNTWYVAAEPHEIGGAPFGRKICGENIVFWRTEDGEAVAFEDRCCHRRMPLRKGAVEGNVLRCHYHGLEFNPSGACVHVPGQTTIPPGAQVRTYPVVERYNWIWIWMGDAALADESQIIGYPWKTADDWGDKGTYFHVNGDYKLVIDNLLDLSHLAFVHKSTIGNAAVADHAVVKTLKDEDSVTVARWTVGQNPPPTYQRMCGWPEDTIIDRWQIIEYRAPGAVRLFTGAAPDAAEGKEFGHTDHLREVPENGFGFHNLNFVTPETETSCHYFWSNAYKIPGKPVDEALTEMSYKQIHQAFHQDWEVFDLQQENWDDRPTIETNQDAGGIAARALLDRKIGEEQATAGAAVAAE
jgi:phenylpropionate dioxygenase-like ring-hydroxylating dioxygenase large terminal subunit